MYNRIRIFRNIVSVLNKIIIFVKLCSRWSLINDITIFIHFVHAVYFTLKWFTCFLLWLEYNVEILGIFKKSIVNVLWILSAYYGEHLKHCAFTLISIMYYYKTSYNFTIYWVLKDLYTNLLCFIFYTAYEYSSVKIKTYMSV